MAGIPGPKPQSRQDAELKGTRPSEQLPEKPVEFPMLLEVPKCPPWVKYRDGKKMWAELAPILQAQRVMTQPDWDAFAHLCHLHGHIVDNSRKLIKTSASDYAQLRMMFEAFGMTPASRNRIGQAGSAAPENPFRKNGRSSKQ